MNQLLDYKLRQHSSAEKLSLKEISEDEFEKLLKDPNARSDEFLRFVDSNFLARVISLNKENKEFNLIYDDDFMTDDEDICFYVNPRFLQSPLHKHAYIEMIYMYSGSCKQIINNRPITFYEGDLCIFDCNTYHIVETCGENDIMINCLMKKDYFDAKFMCQISSENPLTNFLIHAIYEKKDQEKALIIRSQKENPFITKRFNSILETLYDNKPYADLIVNHLVQILFIEIVHNIDVEDYIYQEGTHNKTINILEVLNYIQNNYADVTLSEVANRFYFDADYLSKIIKNFTNQTFIQFVQKQRLTNAAILINNSKLTVEEIAHQVGYANMNYFYKLFKNEYHCTPAEYRNQTCEVSEEMIINL